MSARKKAMLAVHSVDGSEAMDDGEWPRSEVGTDNEAADESVIDVEDQLNPEDEPNPYLGVLNETEAEIGDRYITEDDLIRFKNSLECSEVKLFIFSCKRHKD